MDEPRRIWLTMSTVTALSVSLHRESCNCLMLLTVDLHCQGLAEVDELDFVQYRPWQAFKPSNARSFGCSRISIPLGRRQSRSATHIFQTMEQGFDAIRLVLFGGEEDRDTSLDAVCVAAEGVNADHLASRTWRMRENVLR